MAHITANWLTPYKVREITISTTEKLIRGWFSEQKVQEFSRYEEEGSYVVKELKVPISEPLRLELEKFLKSVRNHENVAVTGEDGLKALEVAIQCLRGAGGVVINSSIPYSLHTEGRRNFSSGFYSNWSYTFMVFLIIFFQS